MHSALPRQGADGRLWMERVFPGDGEARVARMVWPGGPSFAMAKDGLTMIECTDRLRKTVVSTRSSHPHPSLPDPCATVARPPGPIAVSDESSGIAFLACLMPEMIVPSQAAHAGRMEYGGVNSHRRTRRPAQHPIGMWPLNFARCETSKAVSAATCPAADHLARYSTSRLPRHDPCTVHLTFVAPRPEPSSATS